MKKLFAALALAAVVAPCGPPPRPSRCPCGMTCASCPITVKHALSKVEGVSKTDVSFDKRQAVVTFDDAKTNVQKLTKATEDAGYQSSLKR
ncbi:mercury resistance system periplasmic binding protein MerP [Klebsiella pneumoniae]|uniref:mercury resistance system periplasmic binding protein MerP n=1 Tax=Klebsiella pneumoniae TaxID=573 RepID=UPI003891005A